MEVLTNKLGSNGCANGCSSNYADDNKDKVLADRLERLRAERFSEPPPSLSQLEERLARLKGIPSESTSSQQMVVNTKPDTRTSIERSQDLFNQMAQEVELDARLPNPDDEIRLRLAKLRNDDSSLNDLNKPSASGGEYLQSSIARLMPSTLNGDAANPEILEVWQYMMETEKEVCREAEEALKLQEKDIELKRKLQEIKANRDTSKRHQETKISNGDLSDEDNEDKIADKVIQQFLSESRLDNTLGTLPSVLRAERNKESGNRKERKLINSSDTDETDLEELPWCVICNNDASLRCYGCDGDLYCRRCFRECHETFELQDHPSVSFTPKPNLDL